MGLKAVQQALGSSVVVWVDLEPRINERTNEPGPDRALVISCVAGAQVAVVTRLVIRMVRRQRPQADRREQALLHDLEHRLPARWGKDGMAEGDGQDLIRPAAYQKRLLKERQASAACPASRCAGGASWAARTQPSNNRRALYQSALI